MGIEYSKQAVKAATEDLPDDVATAGDLAAIKAAREEYARGEAVPHEAIDWS